MTAKHTSGPWFAQQSAHPGGLLIKPIPGPVVAQCDELPEMEANANLLAAAPTMADALKQWACPSCGGKGTYQQDAKGRARKEAQGKAADPHYQPDPVVCKVCNGTKLHPTALAALQAAKVLA